MTTIHYVTEMVEAATGKLVERKLLTVKSSNAANAVMARIQAEHKSSHRRGEFRCTITKMWVV
jgi:folate-dependent phosphoribosylglycinamide formyltransferase PurN